MIFQVAIDATLEADSIEHALSQLAEHFQNAARIDGENLLLSGTIDIHPVPA